MVIRLHLRARFAPLCKRRAVGSCLHRNTRRSLPEERNKTPNNVLASPGFRPSHSEGGRYPTGGSAWLEIQKELKSHQLLEAPTSSLSLCTPHGAPTVPLASRQLRSSPTLLLAPSLCSSGECPLPTHRAPLTSAPSPRSPHLWLPPLLLGLPGSASSPPALPNATAQGSPVCCSVSSFCVSLSPPSPSLPCPPLPFIFL